jgi:serine/threonine protein phosphatase PrpC
MSAQASSAPQCLASIQHRGLVPREQQDALLAVGQVWQANDLAWRHKTSEMDTGLCAVADGVAASYKPQLVSRALLELLRDADQAGSEHWQDGWIGPRALRRVIHPRLCRQLSRQPALHASATTLAMLQWRDGHFSALNVGDSRIYCIAAGGEWRQVSVDHTDYQSMLARGELQPGEDVGQLYHDLEHMISANETEDDFAIHWQTGRWPEGSTWLLCTDGLHDTLNQADMEALFDPEAPLPDLAGRYRQAVLSAGAPDNLSLILAR